MNWFPPRLISLLDYFLLKAPYWSVHNYEKRLEVDVREGLMGHVEEVHKNNRQELSGLSGTQSRIHAVLMRSLQKVGSYRTGEYIKKRRDCNQTRRGVQAGATQSIIVKVITTASQISSRCQDEDGLRDAAVPAAVPAAASPLNAMQQHLLPSRNDVPVASLARLPAAVQ